MKIAMIQSFLPSRSQGGVGHCAHQLAQGLAERGHDVTLFSLDPAVPGAAYRTRTLPGADAAGRRAWLEPFLFGVRIARLDFDDFDVIHAHGDSQWLRPGPPVLRTFHGSCFDEALRARRPRTRGLFLLLYLLEMIAALRADLCVGVSEASGRRLPVRGVSVVPEGVDLTVFRPGPLKSPVPSVLFVGHRMKDRKRADLLVRSFESTVLRSVPQAILHLVCDDETPVRPWLVRHTKVATRELVALYQSAWVFCLPSAYEGFGRPYVEAMACGTPVVATDNPGAREILGRDAVCGRIVREGDLGEAIAFLLAHPDERRRLGEAGLARARERFGLQAMITAYERLYVSLAAGGRRAAVADATGLGGA